jgi:hypothetical protein
MTYQELKEALIEFTDEQLQQDVTVYVSDNDEFYPLVDVHPLVESDDKNDVLDVGHKYLVI